MSQNKRVTKNVNVVAFGFDDTTHLLLDEQGLVKAVSEVVLRGCATRGDLLVLGTYLKRPTPAFLSLDEAYALETQIKQIAVCKLVEMEEQDPVILVEILSNNCVLTDIYLHDAHKFRSN